MTQGIQVFKSDGSLMLDITDRVYRLLTVQNVGSSGGSIGISELTQGVPVLSLINSFAGGKLPTVTVVGTTVTWTYGSIPSAERDANAQLSIGVF